jgi:Flp pilus assembly protein TadD
LWQGEFAQAEPYLHEALKLNSSFQAHNDLGVVYYATGRFEQAASEFQAALDRGGSQMEPWGGLGDAYRQLGRRAEARDAYGRAIDLARQRLSVDSEDAALRAGLAMFLAGSGRCAEAGRESAQASRGPQADATTQFYAAVAYAICGDHEAAVRHAIKALDGGAVGDLVSNPDLRAVREDARLRERLRRPERAG